MLNLTFRKIWQDVYYVFYRFPFSVISSLFLTLILLNHYSLPTHWDIVDLYAIFVVGILLFVSIKLMSDTHKWNHWLSTAGALFLFGSISLYIYNLTVLLYPASLIIAGFFLLPTIAPFLKKNVYKEHIWYYNYRLWSHFFFSMLVCFILLLGINSLLISLDYLFHFKFFPDQYQKLFIIIGFFCFPVMVLAGIPARFEELPKISHGHKIRLVLDYILTPVLLVFGVIIICYAFKIMIAQDLPRGNISSLVMTLSGTGVLAYILGDNGTASLSRPHQFFRKYFFLMMIIPLILMGIGTRERISQYGFTEFRYLNVLALLWLSLNVLYSLICSREKIVRFMLASACGLLLLSSFGPWGITEICAHSQLNRLQTLLERNHILVNKTITKTLPPISSQDRHQIQSILQYIDRIGKTGDLNKKLGTGSDKALQHIIADQTTNTPPAKPTK